jgi:hypothetical protein
METVMGLQASLAPEAVAALCPACYLEMVG